jgi:hypothetical protein
MMSGLQEFTPEQLERIESAVNSVFASTDDPRTPGAVVKDILRNQDLTNARSGLIIRVKKSSPVGFLRLPAEIRNMIYRYCLVVGEVYPRAKPEEDDRLSNRSNFQKAQTQVFEVCRQIFTEAAPLYFAENKFILSYGKLPWSYLESDLVSKPVSRAAQQNLRSLSITYDVRQCQISPSDLQASVGDCEFELKLAQEWNDLADLLRLLELQLLEVSFKGCYCAYCKRRMTHLAISYLLNGIMSTPRVVLTGLVNSVEVYMVRRIIRDVSYYFPVDDKFRWRPQFDDEDPDDSRKIAFQVTR